MDQTSRANKLKNLNYQKREALNRLEAATERHEETKRALGQVREEVQKLIYQISQLEKQSKEPIVSEHAMLRFLERHMGVDLNQVAETILTDELKKMIGELGDGDYPITQGFKARVRGNTIVTIIGEHKE